MNSQTVARLEQLFPPLKSKGYQHLQLLKLKGIDVEISQGLRTWPQQQTLWQEGRNPDGSYVNPVTEAGVVTHAKPGQSYHNYGLAYDIAIIGEDGKANWDVSTPEWQLAISIGESLGLTAGAEWHGKEQDNPHFQLTGSFPLAPDDELLAIYQGGGIQAVWDEVNKSLSSGLGT